MLFEAHKKKFITNSIIAKNGLSKGRWILYFVRKSIV